MIKKSQEITINTLDQFTQLWSRMIACIIHDLTTPLVLTRMAGSNIHSILPKLITGYQLAVDNHLIAEEPIAKKFLKEVEANLAFATGDNINHIFQFLNALLPLCNQLLSTAAEAKVLSIRTVIKTACQQYPFTTEQQRALVHDHIEQDFQFQGIPLFVESLFEHLLANSLKLIEMTGKGEIYIRTATDEKNNLVYFTDTATTERDLEGRIFDQFFCKKLNKIQPGLGFCKLALLKRGGDIRYQVGDKGMGFTILFPSLGFEVEK